MQGVVCMQDNLQTGSPPPNKEFVPNPNMDISPDLLAKDSSMINQSDSGILSATTNSTFTDDHMDQSNRSESGDTDNRSDCSSPHRKYLCPICETMLTSQHKFTLHIRSHNNESEIQDADKGFTCRICSKVLSSISSLDRHVLVHSGERPFTCKYCGDTFTTNGNMHRHMRTHSQRNENYESDGSTDSASSKSVEYNNNKISTKAEDTLESKKRKCSVSERKNCRIKTDAADNENAQNFSCPVCERNDFTSLGNLEIHLEDNHPDYPAKCQQCCQVFKNSKMLAIHRTVAHSTEESNKNFRNSVLGFTDLTFVDFSSEKFPHIARYECEKNLHKVLGGLKFQCERCSKAFPCHSSLEFHQKDCTLGLDLTIGSNTDKTKKFAEKDVIKRADFFAKLDLQTNPSDVPESAPETPKLQQRLLQPIDTTKDLADIQSIISITTNGSLLQQLQAKTNEIPVLPPNSNSQETSKNENEEETQDLFAAEFRKMKLRGEFPCRLCTAIFPNLRALKGHNRAHLNGNNNGTYRCNMCPHSSIDKAALIRHMRTHNGDRPYECALCNYAFTTKANCERHLRNRHAKTTREEVKKSIIYHPSEDPSNEEISKIVARDDIKKLNTNLNVSTDSSDVNPEKIRSSTPKSFIASPEVPPGTPDLIPQDLNVISSATPTPLANNLLTLKETLKLKIPKDNSNNLNNINEIIRTENLKSLKDHRIAKDEPVTPPYIPPHFGYPPKLLNVSTPQNLSTKLHVKSFEALKLIPQYEDRNRLTPPPYKPVEHPMDLVLDLSKKKTETQEINATIKFEEKPQDLSKKNPDMITPNVNEIVAQQLLKNTPKIDPASLYASQLAFYRNGFPALPTWPFSLNPLLLQSMQNHLLPQDHRDIKSQIHRMQLCGGGMMVDNFTERLKTFHQQSLGSPHINNFNKLKLNEVKPEILKFSENNYPNLSQIKQEDTKPLSINVDHQNFTENLIKMQSPIPQPKSEIMHSPNSVKMVIKNGVLMPKQKQRRYRTERPFSCEHCSARFTLRSNMERHIKQQHPQFWSQRQRSNIGNATRKNQQSLSGNPKNNYCSINIPSYDIPKIQDLEDTKDNQISDKIKYAILAQHLKAARNNYNIKYNQDPKKEHDEDDCALVIDEETSNKNDDKTERNNDYGGNTYENICKTRILEEKLKQLHAKQNFTTDNNISNVLTSLNRQEDAQDLVPVSRLLDNASQQQFKEYFRREGEEREGEEISEEDEEGLVASSSTSDGNISGTDENRSESENPNAQIPTKKKSAYSLAPNRVSCPYCQRKFPWTSSLRRHVLTHTGQKPFKCSHCPLLFTTKSNCDRHLLRKHGNSANTVNTESSAITNSNYMMRNVPERPFKCSNCPSSTFSTYSNLKKHISCKHQGAQSDDARSQISTGYEAGSSEDEKMPLSEQKSEWDKQISHSKTTIPNSEMQSLHLQNSDLPFKCHLCDSSFSERTEALDHIKDKHTSEYELLMSKNALDTSASTPDENLHHDDNDEGEVRGKFPDYANRKVICAFCMRRFWSAEDLRRHMRTHTGERPFSCDICHRRFTLKHSMLRHRKKHNLAFENEILNSDEDVAHFNPAFDKFTKGNNNNMIKKIGEKTDESDGTEGNDLISNLLGIRDRSIIDQVLTSSADDAAKLLGVKSGVQE